MYILIILFIGQAYSLYDVVFKINFTNSEWRRIKYVTQGYGIGLYS